METRAMTAVAMCVGMLGCATAGLPPVGTLRPAAWIQDAEVALLAEHFQKTVDCRPGTKDPHAFMCPLAQMRVERFVPPTPERVRLGIQLEIDATAQGLQVEFIKDRLVSLVLGPRMQAVALSLPNNRADEEWNRAIYDALLARLAGRREPFALPPTLVALLKAPVGEGRGPANFYWQPDRFFRVHDAAGSEVIVHLEPLEGARTLVSLFPMFDALAEGTSHPELQRAMEARYAATAAQSDPDLQAPPVGTDKVLGMRDHLQREAVCTGEASWAPEFCAISNLALGRGALPPRDGVYVGLLYEFFRDERGWRERLVQRGTLSLLELGPDRFRPGTLGPDDREELDAISKAEDVLEAHLTGKARGAIVTTKHVLRDVSGLSRLPVPPLENSAARLYEGYVPGGDQVYVVFTPRKGGGVLIGLYPKVPWYPATETAGR